nr:MAG TPA: hypothetical protein [Caudoviricetes sp.]
MEFAVLTKTGEPIGKATDIAHVLTLCGIEYDHKERRTKDEQYPLKMHVIARKKYTIGSWFEQSYVLKCKESAWSDCGFTYHDALKRAVRDMFKKCRKEFMIVPL